MVDRQAVLSGLREAVGVVAGLLGHGENRAGVRIEDDRGRALRLPLAHRLLEHLLGVCLHVTVEREEDIAPGAGRAVLDRVHGLAERVPHYRRAPGRP